jgi:hypothetical protein
MLERFVAYLVERLQKEGRVKRALSSHVSGSEAHIGSRDRWVLHVVIQGPRVVLRAIDPSTAEWRDHDVDSLADLDACFGVVAESVRGALAQLTVHRLQQGRRYRIAQSFRDFYGHEFVVGEELVFEELHFLAHDDGYTLRFVERSMWISGGSEEYARFGLLVVRAPADSERADAADDG